MAQYEPVLLKYINYPNQEDIAVYEHNGGYQAIRRALKGTPEELLQAIKDSGLRGRGGAFFPTGVKLGFMPRDRRPTYLCANADESEPGTVANRPLMERDPHQVLEGIMLACYAGYMNTAFIYIRGEFLAAYRALERAIAQAYARGYLGRRIFGSDFDLDIFVHRGAGAYICGEETALMESLDGRRPQPRLKPPFPAQRGIFGQPTTVNNIETLACLVHIVNRGVAWFRSVGSGRRGPRSSASLGT